MDSESAAVRLKTWPISWWSGKAELIAEDAAKHNIMDSASDTQLDILAIAAHRDDVEQTCGGTLLKMSQKGHRTGVLDLTRGEMGTRGTAADREREANEAARLMGVTYREALDIPDARVENTWVNRLKVARLIRRTRPRVVILPYWKGRHPDHYTSSTLGYEACFLAGLKKLDITHKLREEGMQMQPEDELAPHRPFKIVYATLYYDVRPSFVVDITDQFEARFAALMAYKSQFEDQREGSGIFPAHQEIRDRIHSMTRFYGMMAGVQYAEPFLQKEVGLVEDLLTIPVQSI
jgi:N-acetylglucosamine malate deacetylase 1